VWLTRFAISRWVITLMVFAALIIFGAISFTQLGRSTNPPNTDFPVVVVFASYPGASPQDMERMVIKPIEDQMQGVEHLDELDATAQEGSAVVVALYKMGTNVDLAAIDVQRRVDTARVYMPTDLDPPTVSKEGESEPPLLDIAISSKDLTQPQIADVVNNQVEPLVAQIPNVQTVNVYGTANREFHVLPSQMALDGTGATLEDIFNTIQGNNANVPGGIMTQPTQEATVAVHSYIEQAQDLALIPLSPPTVLAYPVKGLKVGDVASVEDSHVEMRTISHYNGEPRVYMEIDPTLDADQVKSTATAREQMKAIEAKFPQLIFNEIDAPADYTVQQLNGVFISLGEGIVLTALVMLLFLHAWRNAVVVFLAIPTSIMATFILMKLFNFHIDGLSMMGLSLIIGILVDDSIVVLENITRHRDLGEDALNAAITGRSEIGSAAVAITMVDVIVFLPIAFLPGIVGAYLKEFAAVVVIATLFSLLVSFTLTPLLAARWSVLRRSRGTPGWLLALDNRLLDAGLFTGSVVAFGIGQFTGWHILNVLAVFVVAALICLKFVVRYDSIVTFYQKLALPWALRHGSFVVFVCAALFLNAISLAAGGGQATFVVDAVILTLTVLTYAVAFGMRRFTYGRAGGFAQLGSNRGLAVITLVLPVVLAGAMFHFGVSTDFVPSSQNGEIDMVVNYPSGTPIATTDGYVVQLEKAIAKLDGVKSVSSTVGRKQLGHGSVTGGNFATLNATMRSDRIKETDKTTAAIRKLAYLVPGGELQVAGDTGNGSAIFYALTGPDDAIGPAAEKVAQYLRGLPGTVNVTSSAETGAPRLNVDIDRGKCTLVGVNPADAATVARIAVDGAVATRVRTSTGLVDVRIQFPLAMRSTVDQLMRVNVRANDGSLVPLGSLATFTWTTAPTKIERMNRQRVVNIVGDLLPGYSLGDVTGPLNKKLVEPGFLPEGVGLKPEGNSQYMVETFMNMGIALVLSFMLVYMLMVILYGSFLEPFIVMFSVPLAVIGALTFLGVLGKLPGGQAQSLNIVSMLGVIMLFGLVAKNGILLVDYSNTLCKRGMRVRDAVLQACATRFRPIIMTTVAMIFGMLPLSLGYDAGSEWRQAIGTVIIGGLLSSLILTLFLVPMIYNTWMGWFERRADRKAVAAELHGAPATV
jgi:HAE1 family hydrophobic/amphiphilic exporter-1